MNTFLNIQQESVLPAYWGTTHFLQVRAQKDKQMKDTKRFDLQKRITKRGYDEQYKAHYLSGYHGKKRASRNYIVTTNTI